MLEVILDIKNNKRKLVKDSNDTHDTILRCIRSYIQSKGGYVWKQLKQSCKHFTHMSTFRSSI